MTCPLVINIQPQYDTINTPFAFSSGKKSPDRIECCLLRSGSHDPTLGSSNRCGLEDTVEHDPGREKSLEKSENVSVGDPLGHKLQNDRMRNFVKESFNIGVEYHAVPGAVKRQNPLDGQMTTAVFAKSEGGIVKERVEKRLEKSAEHFLSDAIANDRNAQRSELFRTRVFGDKDTAQRTG